MFTTTTNIQRTAPWQTGRKHFPNPECSKVCVMWSAEKAVSTKSSHLLQFPISTEAKFSKCSLHGFSKLRALLSPALCLPALTAQSLPHLQQTIPSLQTGRENTRFSTGGWKWMGSWIILAQIYSHVLATTTRTSGLAVWVSLAGDQQNPCFFLSCPACRLSFSPRCCLSSLHIQTPDGSKFFRLLSISDLQLNPHSGTPVTALSVSLLRHFIRQTSKCVQ